MITFKGWKNIRKTNQTRYFITKRKDFICYWHPFLISFLSQSKKAFLVVFALG